MIQLTSYAATQIDSFHKKTENNDCSNELVIYRILLQRELKEIFANVEKAFEFTSV